MNHQYQSSIQDDVSEISYYTTPPTSPISQPIDLDIEKIDMIQLESLITTNNSLISKNDNFDNLFDDLLLISDSNSQKSNSSTSNATVSNFMIESPRNKEFNLTSNSTENTEKKGQEDLIKIDILQCQFSYLTKPQSSIETTELGDMAFLYRRNKDILSVCFNRMQYEAAIPLNQLTGFCIVDDGKIFIKLKKDYQLNFSHHLGEFPYLLEPTPMDHDPTDGKFGKVQSLLLTPTSSERISTLSSLESSIEKLYFQKIGIHNEAVTENGLKMYLTCVFPHERRAIAFPMNSPFHRLLAVIENRFEKKSPTIRHKRKNEWIEVNDDETWKIVKGYAFGRKILRLELHVL